MHRSIARDDHVKSVVRQKAIGGAPHVLRDTSSMMSLAHHLNVVTVYGDTNSIHHLQIITYKIRPQ